MQSFQELAFPTARPGRGNSQHIPSRIVLRVRLSSSTRLKSWTNQVVSGVQNHDNIDLLLTTTNDPAGQMDSSFTVAVQVKTHEL